MLIYILYFLVIAALAIQYEFQPFESSVPLVILVLALAFMAGFQANGVTKDYDNYQASFEGIYEITASESGGLYIYEPGFLAVVLFCRILFKENYGLACFAVFAFSSVLLKIISIKRTPYNPYLVILFYLTGYFVLQEMTEIRIGVASAIFLIGVIYYIRGNTAAYIGLILLATCFHYSAILYLVTLFFRRSAFNYYIFGALLALALVLGFVQVPVLDFLGGFVDTSVNRVAVQLELVQKGYITEINVFNVVNLFGIACCSYFLLFVPKKVLLSDKYLTFFLKCYILAIFLLSLLSGVASIAFRVSELFGVVSMFLYAGLVKHLPFSKFNIFVLILISALFFYIILFHSDLLRPYSIIRIK